MPTPRIQRTQETTALPGARLSPNAPAGAFGGNALPDLRPATRAIAEILTTERQKADQIAVADADGKLSELETRLQLQAQQRRGKDAFSAPEDVLQQWDDESAKVEGSLGVERQKMMLREHARQRRLSLFGAVQRHVAGERTAYDNQVTESLLTNERNAAIASPYDTARIGLSVDRQRAAIKDHARRNGLPPEWVEEKTSAAVSATHMGVIERYLTTGEDRTATAYYQAHKGDITGPDATRIEKALEVGSTEGEGMRAASEAWKQLGPKAPNDPVRIATLEEHIRSEYGNDPKVVRAAIQELRSRAQAFNAEQQELTASNTAAVLGAYNNGAGLSQVVTMPQYRALSGTEQEKVKSYIVDRSRQLSERAETEKTKQGWAAYWRYSEPATLAAMTETQVAALEPEIGHALTNQLLTQQRAMKRRADGVITASIDTDQFNTLAKEAGFNPYDKPDADERARLGQLKNAAENAISAVQERQNRPLTRDEKATVLKALIDDTVMVERFGRDRSRPLATLNKDERDRAYTPIASIPPGQVTKAINWLRSVGAIDPKTTDADARKKFEHRIERAHAAERLYGPTSPIIGEILQGKR